MNTRALALMTATLTGLAVWLVPLMSADAQSSSTNPHGPMSIACTDCHTTSGWSVSPDAVFDHASTGYPLEGQHTSVACAGCHTDLRFAFVATACADCHTDVHDGDLGLDCERCHDTMSWDARAIDRDPHADGTFPLVGPHAAADCESCHGNQPADSFTATSVECWECHMEEAATTKSPDHTIAGFGADCAHCHAPTMSSFSPSTYVHQYPLLGAHATLECAECHGEQYDGTPTTCFGCHEADYTAAADPPHDDFPEECQLCHSQVAWEPASFNHETVFPLVGAHATIECASCHTDGYAGTPTECIGCHQEDFANANDPPHTDFPETCESCHTQVAWEPADFDHDAFFPLLGAHAPLECASCHSDGYAGTPTACIGCHQADYDGANDPPHADFPETCESCHTQVAWEPANFDHDTFFPLIGAHAPLDCASCHSDGYAGTPTECIGCHQADYDGANDPPHDNFPTTCDDCHTQTAWEPADFDHDPFFPIDSGPHREVGNDCANCHVQPSDYSVFECILCHEHSQSSTDSHHNDVNNYVYESVACYDCHPNGRAD